MVISTPWRFAELTAGRFISYATGVDAVAVTVHQTAPAHAPSSGGEPVAAWVNRKTGRVELVASQLGITKAPPTGSTKSFGRGVPRPSGRG